MEIKIILYPGDSIRPVDPIGNDRIRVEFPTSFIKNRSDPIGLLSDSFQSDSDEIGSESDNNPIGSNRYYMRPIGSCQAESTWVVCVG